MEQSRTKVKTMEKTCENCMYAKPKFADESKLTCHRRAPLPYNSLVFHIGELIRNIAWNIYVKELEEEPDKLSELQIETTEAGDYAVWPEVERDDFCGEWEKQDGCTVDCGDRQAVGRSRQPGEGPYEHTGAAEGIDQRSTQERQETRYNPSDAEVSRRPAAAMERHNAVADTGKRRS